MSMEEASAEEGGAQDGRREAPGSGPSSSWSLASSATEAENSKFGPGLPSSGSSERCGKK